MKRNDLNASAAQCDRLHRFSHDIRNRITGLNEAAKMLAEPPNGVSPAELELFAEKQFFGALRCVEDLMDDLEVSKGGATFASERVDLVQLHALAMEQVEYRYLEKQQTISIDHPETAFVNGDPKIMMRCVQALLSNASKFSHVGSEIKILIEPDKDRLRYSVTDSGVGMSEQDLEQVFKRFVILSSRSTAGESQGRSALSRAAGWIEAHRGVLKAESPGVDRGSTFTVELPV